MRLTPDQLAGRPDLAPITLVAGDEPLQLTETLDLLRLRARELGYADREVFDADSASFDWDRLLSAGASLSLFAEKRLFELRLGNGSIGKEGGEALQEYAADPPPDVVLIAACQRYDRTIKGSRWATAVDRAGVLVEVRMPIPAQLPEWLRRRMHARGLQPDAEAVQLLAERVEGNLVAAAQEIEKLVLLGESGPLGVDAVLSAVTDSAQFDVYDLVDALLDGDLARTTRVLDSLHDEGVAETLAVWALARELRSLAAMASEVAAGRSAGQVMQAHHVWSNRQSRVGRALRRVGVAAWQQGVRDCARIDAMAKGQAPGHAWQAIRVLATRLAGGPAMAGLPH